MLTPSFLKFLSIRSATSRRTVLERPVATSTMGLAWGQPALWYTMSSFEQMPQGTKLL